ncbi:hypothetical protein HDU87_006387 [Geranomyces variabilis]|uniref:PX domain-containing protein n=1 Tax=Geranomyces variabilis TaxID=109894 RepID=A0AAD5TFC7_9FUNG|nr:hypothetical protein HDU87_006387 [Geranomyces variabilis]
MAAQSQAPSSFTAHRPLTPAVKLAPLIRTARVTECLKLDDGKHWFKITVFPKPLLHSHNRSHSTSLLTPPSTPPPPTGTSNSTSTFAAQQGESPRNNQVRGRSPSSAAAAAAAAAEAAAAAHSLPYCIWRRYEHFVDFHSALTSQMKRDTTNYPTTTDFADSSSSSSSPSRDTLPVLPKSRFFVTRAVCEERVVRLDEYVRLLLDMDQRVTRNILVAEFFGVWPKDAGGGNNEPSVLNETHGDEQSESHAQGNNTQKPSITLSRKSEDNNNRQRQDRRFNLPLPVVHKIETRTSSSSSRPKAETLNAKSARRAGKALKYHGAADNNEDEDDVELDEAWLKPVQDKRRSRMILDPSFGPGLNTLLRNTGARNYLTEPENPNAGGSSGAASPRRPSHSHIQATPQTYMTTTMPAASPMMATSRPPVPLRKTSGSEYTSSSNVATLSRQTNAGGALILDIPHRSHSRNWSSSGTLSPLFSSSAENQSPFFTANAATAAASSASATTTSSSSSSARTSPLRSHTTSAASSPRSADKSLPRLLQESQSLYAILGAGSASSPTLDMDDLVERAGQPVRRRRSKSTNRRPTGQSREDGAVSVNENQESGMRPPRKSSESKRAVRDREREPLTPPTSASPSPPPTFGAPAVDGAATLERGQARQVVVVNQSPTRLVAPLRAMTLTRHQSTPTMDNVGSDNTVSPGIPSPPMASASPLPPPMSADSGYPRHPDLAPASLHRTLTDPLLMRRTPSPESSPLSALPAHLRSTSPVGVATAAENATTTAAASTTPLPNIPQRKPSLLSRAKTTLGKKSPSPPPTAQQDPDDPTIPPWNRLARSNSVKHGIIYDNPPPRDAPPMPFPATLARARTYNATPPPAETEFRIPRSFTTTAGGGGGGGAGPKLPVRTNSTRAGQPPRAPRRANTLTATTALGAHFIHLKAQYMPPPKDNAATNTNTSTSTSTPVTILLKVSRTTALGVVTARLQDKFAAVLQGDNANNNDASPEGRIKVLGLTYMDEDGCQIEVCDDEDWMVLCAAAKGKVVVGKKDKKCKLM